MLILAFYIPPPFQFAVLKEDLAFMAQHPTVPAAWIGDFNMVMTDTWTLKYPTTTTFSCFTPSPRYVPHRHDFDFPCPGSGIRDQGFIRSFALLGYPPLACHPSIPHMEIKPILAHGPPGPVEHTA